jgi:hypothetical protein
MIEFRNPTVAPDLDGNSLAQVAQSPPHILFAFYSVFRSSSRSSIRCAACKWTSRVGFLRVGGNTVREITKNWRMPAGGSLFNSGYAEQLAHHDTVITETQSLINVRCQKATFDPHVRR